MRHLTIILAFGMQYGLSFCLADEKQQPAAANPVDSISQQASRLEAELGKFKDSSPEAANTLVKLVDLYHSHGRGFGLIRSGQKFVAAHPSDKRHHDVMLKLIDGLESMSRDKELIINCRQYLTRYPKSGAHRSILERLALALEKQGDRIGAAEACHERWKREANVNGRRWGARAAGHYATGKREQIELGAALCEEMFDKLPKDQFARHIGLRAFSEWRRINDWAHSNVVGHKLLRSPAPLTPNEKRFVHQYMAENSVSLGQHSNAVQSLVTARSIRDDQALHASLIQRLHQAAAKSQQMEPVVQDYLRKYPTRIDRGGMLVLLAHAYIRDKNTQRALQLLDAALAIDATAHDAAGLYVRTCGTTPQQFAQSERALKTAISRNKNPQNAWYLRYVLAFQVYRDGLKNPARAKQTLREMFANHPPNDGNSWNALSWLLSSAENDGEFRADVNRMLVARRQNIHLSALRMHLATWAKNTNRNKELKSQAQYVTAELRKANADPVIPVWIKLVQPAHVTGGSKLRQQLLVPALFNRHSLEQKRALLNAEGYFLRNWGKKRDQAAGIYGQLCALTPNDFPAAVAYLQTATDYAPKEVCKQAALHLLRLKPQSNDSDIWRRLFIVCDKNEDDQLARRVHTWVQAAVKQFGTNPTYAATIGDALLRRKMEKEAVAWWTRHMTTHREHRESLECALRLLGRMTEPAPKIALLTELLKHDTDLHERYAQLLAEQLLVGKDLTRFEQILNTSIQRRLQRPLRSRSLETNHLSGLVNTTRGQMEWTDQEKLRLYTVIRNLEFDWPSAVSALLILEATPSDAQQPMPRLLSYARTTKMVYNDTHRWNQLMPFAQSLMKREDYVATSTLLTGMLANITNVSAEYKSSARNMVSQSYARLGSVGLTIDETSPLAPLLQAALYLRLGDQQLALEAYTANQTLFDTHRDQVPIDLLLFVCRNLMAAGGEQNFDRVEDILRSWLVKNSESAQFETSAKAEVQLLLARNYFSAQRYDIARSEYTTVINRYADTPFALDAEFGIGETFMAQKVYDQAEAVFEKLASSRDADTVVRAEFLRGVLSHRRGDHDEARQIFRGVLERVPNVELANRALFNLAEVYGAEERYIEQLNLLQTVGRLGRTSKRRHTPGMPLSIVVQDSDLGISRGHNKIPVIIRTAPGGDEEMVYLLSGGAGKGLFRIDVETQLGQVVKQDKVLQLTGNDVIRCDYPQEFKAEFRSVPLSDVEIRIAANGVLEVSSSKIVDEKQETFSERLEREARERAAADARVSQQRPTNQIKPGNPIHLRVADVDRDLTDAVDEIIVKLVADSGDQVQVPLKETGSHTGLFEGSLSTGELPAGALASDTAIEHSPLMAIDQDPKSAWISEPDGATPKSLTVDMKNVHPVGQVWISTPDTEQRAPVRGRLLGSNDGEFWYRLASFPEMQTVAPVAQSFENMQYRMFSGNYTSYTDWNQVVSLGRTVKPAEQGLVEGTLSWPAAEDDEKRPAYAMIWSGKLLQPRDGAMRIAIRGARSALVLDGVNELPLGPGNRSIDVWLDAGLHELVVFAAVANGKQAVSVVRARADVNRANVALTPFIKSDFDLEHPVAQAALAEEPQPEKPQQILSPDTGRLTKQTPEFGVQSKDGQTQLASWKDLGDWVSWDANFAHPGYYDLFLEYSHQGGGSRFRVEFNAREIEAVVPNTGNWQTFHNSRVATLRVDTAGRHTITIKPLQIQNGELMQLRSVRVAAAQGERAVAYGPRWEFRFEPRQIRHVRFMIDEYLGESVAVNHMQIRGPQNGTTYIPTEDDLLELASNNVLEIAGGDVVTATYTDEQTQTTTGTSRLLTGKLTATYFDGSVTPISYDLVKSNNGGVNTIRKQLKRVDPGERFVVEVVDYDRDQTAEPDTVDIVVLVNNQERLRLTATETDAYSGIFTKEVDTSAKMEQGKLHIKPGDQIQVRYLDQQNTFPGHEVARETVVYANKPTEGRIRVLESRVTLPDAEANGPPQITYLTPDEDVELSRVAFEAPLTVEVIDPDAAKDSRSEVTVAIQTTDGAVVKVRCVVSSAFAAANNVPDWALEEGRFIGQVIMQLGSSGSPKIVPMTANMPRNLVGRPLIEDTKDNASPLDQSLVTQVLNLTGKDRITTGYRDKLRPSGKSSILTAQARLISNARLACTDRDYEKNVTQLHVGEKLFLMVTDADRDSSEERDQTTVTISSEFGEKESVVLQETLAHSGVFTGSFALKSQDKPTPGNLDPETPVIECYFGDTLKIHYLDPAASTDTGNLELSQEIPVVIGTDGLVAAFSKTFNDENLAVETKFHIAESYFELFKSHRSLKRTSEERQDLAAGRRILKEVMQDFPDPKYVPRVSYLLGQFAQELEQWEEAMESYQLIVRQFPEHALAADAQYKLAQSYEESGDFDAALEAYVTLAATYPKSPLIANVMIRISDHFYKAKKYDVAAQVGEKFLQRFEGHQFSSRMAFRIGQCFYKSESFTKAGDSFDRFAKIFPEDSLTAYSLFWAGESFRMAKNNQQAFRRYNRCRWDFPSSEAAKFARGRLALPEMLQQFEAEASSLENQ